MCVLQHHHQVPDDRYASAHGVRLDLIECFKRLDITNHQVNYYNQPVSLYGASWMLIICIIMNLETSNHTFSACTA